MAGLLGVGGGIIIVPISYLVLLYLDYSSDYAMHIAIASSLGVICFTSISSIRTHIKLNNVNFAILRTWAPGIALGSILGSYSASLISGQVLVNVFIFLAFLIAFLETAVINITEALGSKNQAVSETHTNNHSKNNLSDG